MRRLEKETRRPGHGNSGTNKEVAEPPNNPHGTPLEREKTPGKNAPGYGMLDTPYQPTNRRKTGDRTQNLQKPLNH